MQKNVQAPGKINLSLRVFERLSTGYHRIETVMVKIALADELSVEVSPGKGVRVEVPGHLDLENDRNLAARAANRYLEEAEIERTVGIRLYKKIPITAGLAGGSTDAAAVLRVLDQVLDHALSEDVMRRIAAELGADVPFFLGGHTLGVARGIGEKIETWPSLPRRSLVLVKPPFGISAKEAYEALDRTLTWKDPGDISSALPRPPKNWSDLQGLLEIGNDLERAMIGRYPEVGRIRERLLSVGAGFAQMSGSGPTVFGLFDTKERARDAANRLTDVGAVWVTETLNEDLFWGVDKR